MVPVQPVLDLADLAAILKVTRKTIYRLCARGKLRRVQGLRHIRVTQESLKEFLNASTHHF